MDISVIIPAYNEQEAVVTTIKKVREGLKAKGNVEYEIVVINDGSTDNTINTLKSCDIDFKLIDNQFNRGYGASLKEGIRHSSGNYICIIDADGTYDPSYIAGFYDDVKDNDMVVGARTGKLVEVSLLRKCVKWVLIVLANYLSGTKIIDLNSGLRIFRRQIAEEAMNILPDGFSFTTTITLAALSSGYLIKYVPINYAKRAGNSKFHPIKDTYSMIVLIVRTILYFNPLKIFLPLGFLMLLIGFGVLLGSYFFAEKIMDITFLILLISGIQIISIGLIADLIVRKVKR